jgi:protein-S-isoprenylcysteine O-methyltransferase Ste14
MGAIAGYFLLTEHLAHTLGTLPYLLLAACPMMHLFMHHGHGRHRHPQYVAFVLILLGFLLPWPTLLTLLMFPTLLVMYGRLALTEEADMRALFGPAYAQYVPLTPRFIPRLTRPDATLN